ncbi:hypothetical protein BRAO285_1120005 [Bradyrhizobium sp. ORS 285]|nr:hypothetical protein BRAO285_1120005 [Bradyrhizobium sp. ORS 285]
MSVFRQVAAIMHEAWSMVRGSAVSELALIVVVYEQASKGGLVCPLCGCDSGCLGA